MGRRWAAGSGFLHWTYEGEAASSEFLVVCVLIRVPEPEAISRVTRYYAVVAKYYIAYY